MSGSVIPESHPRFESLRTREMMVAGFEAGVVAREGLMAHGRGEAFDYMMGEETMAAAEAAAEAAAAALLLAERPVLSVNGNVAALCPGDVVGLAAVSGAKIEVNLFYDDDDGRRRRAVADILRGSGAANVLGAEEDLAILSGLDSARRRVSAQGILAADVVMVPLEDGDRAEALRKAGKGVIAVDLNPLSRTARAADITIVDNVTRALPLVARYCREMKGRDRGSLMAVAGGFDNGANLRECISYMVRWLEGGSDA